MAKIITTQYKCDVCNTIFENEKELRPTHIPCYGGERNEYYSECNIDLCEKCSESIRKIIHNHFAEISEWYGTHIKNKQLGE